MYEQVFQRIVYASQNNSLTFFVGAGISTISGAPRWRDLIDEMCIEMGRIPKDDYTSDEYLSIPQMFYYSKDRDEKKYYSFIRGCFEKKKLCPNIIHKMLLDFNPCSFVTTNFDELLEEAAVQNAQGFKVVACDNEISSINGDRYILKVHGDLAHKNIVLKEEDYLNYSERFKLTETVLKAVFSMNTVVFIGYGLNDYNIKLVLNWAKNLLKDQFNEPIFIYTGDEELSREELLYQESKGVTVVEYKKCLSNSQDNASYVEKYKSVLDAIKSSSTATIEGKNDAEAFDALYSLLLPLDKLDALRFYDVQKKLGRSVYIEEYGEISTISNDNNILKRYAEINSFALEEKANLDTAVQEKYEIISSVFRKAKISYIQVSRSHEKIAGDFSFADSNCIGFNYCGMHDFCSKRSTDLHYMFRKGFYLAKLVRYEEAYFCFLEVASEAYKKKNYLMYYLAQVNCNALCTAMKNINRYYHCFHMDKIDSTTLNEKQIEHLFENLPVEFKNTYSSLKDLNSDNLLYEYSYHAFADGKKLENAIESNTFELGLTSSDKAMYRINDYLHFLLGNGIWLDEFVEFKSTVCNLMSLLVYKYSGQNRKKFIDSLLPEFGHEKIEFDEIDFYCFVECFDSSSIVKLFSKHNIDTIEFKNIDIICDAVDNLLKYYENIIDKTGNIIAYVSFEKKIKTCLSLLRFMDIPQQTVDAVCQFIFKYDFREINISDKVLFIDKQIYHRKMYSAVTAKTIEDTLIYYLDSHIKAVENGSKFEVLSTRSNINYCSLVQYISPEKDFYSHRLSCRVSKIITLGNSTLIKHVVNHYLHFISPWQRARLVSWAKKSLREKFDFDLFSMLISSNARIDSDIINGLQNDLRIELEENEKTKSEKSIVETYPVKDNLGKLNQVGFWCFSGALKREPFAEFIGNSDKFDFYYLYSHFDFEKFDVFWLINMTKKTLSNISKSKSVRTKIRAKIAEALQEEILSTDDEMALSHILAQYFS